MKSLKSKGGLKSKAIAKRGSNGKTASKGRPNGKAAATRTLNGKAAAKRTLNGKAAAAPETESVDFNNEDYNIRSPERTQLLTQIKGILNNAPVSPAFWACCQLADMNCLRDLATSEKMILLVEKLVCVIPMRCELLGF
jgi:hypothetical protein